MAENLYFTGTFATPTTGSVIPVTTGTSATVLFQLATPSTKQISLVEYGVSFTGTPAGVIVDLRETSTTSVLTHMAAGTISAYGPPGAPASGCTSDWLLAGATNSVAPVATTTQIYDAQLLSTNTYVKQFPLGREPMVPVSAFLICTITVPTTSVSALAYVIWRE
jgi:hypothetical protein